MGARAKSQRGIERQGVIQYEPQRDSKSLREPVRARGSQSGSHRKPKRARETGKEPVSQSEPERAIVSQSESRRAHKQRQ